ncbi:hypothetical protein [Spirosoma gilvum]
MTSIFRTINLLVLVVGLWEPKASIGQKIPMKRLPLYGQFLTDTIEIGRPFQFALTYRHPAIKDVLFPDTALHFAPYRVERVVVFPTQTSGVGFNAISRDSAVYTLVSFETDSVQRLQVPVRVIGDVDCTRYWTQTDSVFLKSKLTPSTADSTHTPVAKLATETKLAALQQQFNYLALATGFALVSIVSLLLYGLFGQAIRRQWRLYQLNRQHLRFLNEYNRFCRSINSYTASDIANQAVVLWKTYLERLDLLPYTSMTTPELAERMADDRITDALREADRMIYGGSFTPQSQPALRLLGEIATQTYRRARSRLQGKMSIETSAQGKSTETTPIV